MDDRAEGQGVYHYNDGAEYKGSVKDNLKHGGGILTYYNGNIYQGLWTNDQKNGKVTYFQYIVFILYRENLLGQVEQCLMVYKYR